MEFPYTPIFSTEGEGTYRQDLRHLHHGLALPPPPLSAGRPAVLEANSGSLPAAMPVSSCSPSYHTFVNPSLRVPSVGTGGLALQQPGGVKKRKGQLPGEVPPKRTRAKKPADAPTRPKSAYMFFLAEFREQWKNTNPESKKVADMAVAAGEAWRSLHPQRKLVYEELSSRAKAQYAVNIEQYQRDHPRPSRYEKVRDPAELKRPQSAYFFFLAEFRDNFKANHPGQAMVVKEMSKIAGERWKAMSPDARRPYEEKSTRSKQEYAVMKTLTAEQRVLLATHGAAALGARLPGFSGGGYGMQMAAPASSPPLGVVPDALHDQQPYFEDSPCYPSYNNTFNSDLTVPQAPDIKLESGYGSSNILVAQQEVMHPDALRLVLQQNVREFKPSYAVDHPDWRRG